MVKTTTLAILLTLVSAPVWAQATAEKLTLEEAIARGLANSLRLAELDARQQAAAAVERGQAASRQPILSIQGGYTRTNHVEEFVIRQPGEVTTSVLYPDAPDNYRTRLDLQWPIYTGGRADALERAARAEREATGQDLAAARADLRLEIARAFWALVTARETEEVLARAVGSMDAHVRDLRSMLDQGLIPPNDLLSTEAQRSRQQVLAIQAANARGIAEADLRRLLGMESSGPIEPAAVLDVSAAADRDVARLIADARAQRPERRALEDRLNGARAQIDAAASGRRPQIAVTGGYDYARPNPHIFPRVDEWNDSWDASVSATWSLWDGGRVKAERAEATATARAAEARVGDFDRQLTFEVQQRLLEVQSSRAEIVAAADGVRSAAEARRVVNERFAAGVATATDVLDAETALLQAELDRTRSLASARLADARLDRAIGK